LLLLILAFSLLYSVSPDQLLQRGEFPVTPPIPSKPKDFGPKAYNAQQINSPHIESIYANDFIYISCTHPVNVVITCVFLLLAAVRVKDMLHII
jgi:hypothetical protein